MKQGSDGYEFFLGVGPSVRQYKYKNIHDAITEKLMGKEK